MSFESRERLVGEREGAARAWESSLRTEQAALQQALVEAEANAKRAEEREASVKEAEEVTGRGRRDVWCVVCGVGRVTCDV